MFKRLSFETWDGWTPMVGFALTAVAFTIIVIRALRMKKGEIQHMANLPLEETPTTTEEHGH